jgi:hypothetical protein
MTPEGNKRFLLIGDEVVVLSGFYNDEIAGSNRRLFLIDLKHAFALEN